MALANPCDVISAQLPELFKCSLEGPYRRIRTPFTYPDGAIVDVFLLESGLAAGGVLSDLGETFRWLASFSSSSLSDNQRELVEDACRAHGASVLEDQIQRSVKNRETFASAVIAISQAALAAADIQMTFRHISPRKAKEEVAEFFDSHGVLFERDERVVGKSGRKWRIDFHTRSGARGQLQQSRSAFINVLSSTSRGGATNVLHRTVSAWHDLRSPQDQTLFVSLFDDTGPEQIWRERDFRLLAGLSEVASWSHPEDVLDLLAS